LTQSDLTEVRQQNAQGKMRNWERPTPLDFNLRLVRTFALPTRGKAIDFEPVAIWKKYFQKNR
jgi:hypothetical protein